MRTYELQEDELGEKILRRIEADGKVWSIPFDPANSDYAEYLRYTAWVEAGNNPEDFWTQDEDLATDTDL